MPRPAIIGFLQLGTVERGRFEPVAAYLPTLIAWPLFEQGHVSEIPCSRPSESAIGTLVSAAGIYSEEQGGQLLVWFKLVPPFTATPWPHPVWSPAISAPTKITNEAHRTALIPGGGTSDVIIGIGETVALIDNQPANAATKLTVTAGRIVPLAAPVPIPASPPEVQHQAKTSSPRRHPVTIG